MRRYDEVRAQVKTFTREDEQVLSKICSEQLPAAIANAVVADRERYLRRRSLGLFNALRQVKKEIVTDGDSVKLQPMIKSFQMNMCDVMLVDECACYVINDGTDDTSRLLVRRKRSEAKRKESTRSRLGGESPENYP